MSVTCKDLLELSYFKKMNLIAGEKGLGCRLTWPYVGQTASVSQWVHGGELLFITGIARDNSDAALENLVSECVNKGLCGLVILVGSEYISEIPSSVIELAEQHSLPLFRMPWDIKLIDVTSEIVDLLMQEKYRKRKSDSFLSRIIFPEAGDNSTMQQLAEGYDIALLPCCFIAIFSISQPSSGGHDYSHIDSVEEKLQQTLDGLCRQNSLNIISMASGNRVICLISQQDEAAAAKAAEYLKTACQLVRKIFPDEEVLLSLGRAYSDNTSIRTSYREARSALELWKRLGKTDPIVSYSQLGFYRLLFKVEPDEIRQYYRYRLSPLLRHDADNQGELISTLRQYLANDCNLLKTSQALYIHRNTLVYRLGKIKELLGSDLDNAQDKLELYNSILAMDFLEKRSAEA